MRAPLHSGIFLASMCFFACVENSERTPSHNSEYLYKTVNGVLFKYAGGKVDSSFIDSMHEYGLHFDSSAALFYPNVMTGILEKDGKYSLKFEDAKIGMATIVPCDAMKNDTVRCSASIESGLGTANLTYATDEFRIGRYAFISFYKGGSMESGITGVNSKAAYFDSIISAGNYDSILYFKGNYIYN